MARLMAETGLSQGLYPKGRHRPWGRRLRAPALRILSSLGGKLDSVARKTGGMPGRKAELGGRTRSHARRGNAVFDAPRRPVPAQVRRAAWTAFPRGEAVFF